MQLTGRSDRRRFCGRLCKEQHEEREALRSGRIPTPEIIRQRCEAIQAKWSPKERESKLVAKPTAVRIPGTL